MKSVSSTTNPAVKNVLALQDTKGRRKQGRFIAEGLRVITTIMENGRKPVEVYVTETMIEQGQAMATPQKLTLVSMALMKKLSSATNPSGILAVFDIQAQRPSRQLTAGLVLANITDPGNMGTMIRTSVAMGVQSVVIVDGVDLWNPKVVQSTAGYIMHTNVFTMSWTELLRSKGQLKLHALVVSQGDSLETITRKKSLIVVGGEANGIPQEWLDDCSSQITIDMPGKAESLNAAIAGSIALYEVFGK